MGIAQFPPGQLFDVVNDHISSYWLELGMQMGFTYDQVMSTAEGFTYAHKLRALYERKCNRVGEYRAVARLVTAVQVIKRMIFVEDDLPGGIPTHTKFVTAY